MKRTALAALAALAVVASLGLSGCSTFSPEMTALRNACAAGDTQACGMAASLDQQRRQNLAARLDGMTLSGGGVMTPMAPLQSTRCSQVGNVMNCRSY